ncbi:CoB--CoM heterodisulfide reductase iron-sulfur subunit A family protein, partial [Candidatus Woesearchaeota archaeon]|nr:CoB--CoM heterodisulfide reductase iron-sulfur subunit A family protein [Candidatus Woesearchaeota archaeon]
MSKTKIGVYVCHCGTNIASKVDVESVIAYAKQIPGVAVAKNYQYMCSDPGQDMIKKDIKEQGLERIVIAACSPRMHETTFRKMVQAAGLNPYLLEIANIREQCSWVHEDKAKATEKAKETISASIARAKLLMPLEEKTMSVIPSALVIGGGVTGVEAALDIAESGFKVYLVEKTGALGGNVTKLNKTYTNLNDYNLILQKKIESLKSNNNAEVYLDSEIECVEGSLGNFKISVNKNGEKTEINTGVIIVATGYDVFDAKQKPELGYGKYENVITSMELEEKLSKDDLKINGKQPKKIFFLQCVGSRDQTVNNGYC